MATKNEQKATPSFETVSARAQAMVEAHQLTPAWVREKLSSQADKLTPELLVELDKELDAKLAEHAKATKK